MGLSLCLIMGHQAGNRIRPSPRPNRRPIKPTGRPYKTQQKEPLSSWGPNCYSILLLKPKLCHISIR